MASRDELASILARSIEKRERLTKGAKARVEQYLNADNVNVGVDDCDEKYANARAKALNDWTAAYAAADSAYNACMSAATTKAERDQCGEDWDIATYNADWDEDTAEIEAAIAWMDCWSTL